MGDVRKLEDARNDAGALNCRIGDAGYFDKDIDKLINEACGHWEEMMDCLKEALRLAKEREEQ